MNKFKFGFTLVELLIVIALLGALAVGLLAALDPFEQLKKGSDTGTRNTVAELQSAAIRYYSIKNSLPWLSTAVGPQDVSSGYSTIFSINEIITAGELKSDFSTIAGGQLANITMMGTSEGVTVCYKPTSKSFRNDPNTKYDGTAGYTETTNNTANCGDPASTTFHCFWCVR